MNIANSASRVAAFATSAFVLAAPPPRLDMPRHGGETLLERICAAPKEGRFLRQARQASCAERFAGRRAEGSESRARQGARRRQWAICASKPDLSTFGGRLAFHEKSLEAHLATVKATRAKLEAFWNSLDDKQKKGFARTGRKLGD